MSKLTQTMKRQLTIGALVYWLPIILIVSLANEITEHEPLFFDVPILTFLHDNAQSWLTTIVLQLTNLGGIGFVALATVIAGYIGYRHFGQRGAAMVVLVAGGAGAMNVVLKLLFQRDRPELWTALINETSYSFPSGHAMASSALAFSVIALYWTSKRRPWIIAAGLSYVAMIGFTRLYLGVHYPSDVLAGWAISFVWCLFVFRVTLRGRLAS